MLGEAYVYACFHTLLHLAVSVAFHSRILLDIAHRRQNFVSYSLPFSDVIDRPGTNETLK
jgi:hypothetical protein